ncbi:MAG: SpoIIE family protein phosphatase [Bdellovibrio sp.]|nr:SpoIIE family protein phosphatase [Bdellovibrio sp.]
MNLKIAFVTSDGALEKLWKKEFENILTSQQISFEFVSLQAPEVHLVFVDNELSNLAVFLNELDHSKKAVFLVISENITFPKLYLDGTVDDLVVFPFRSLEVLSKVYRYQQILLWAEVKTLNASFSDLLKDFRKDLKLAENLQKRKVPVRFPDVRGFKLMSRYLAGIKPGGDFFDVAESKKGDQVSVLLSDSSTYGLSSAVLSALMRVTIKLSLDEVRSPHLTVQKVYDELLSTLGDGDYLSLFFGVITRSDLRLRYSLFGKCYAFYAPVGEGFITLEKHGGEIRKLTEIFKASETELFVNQDDRIVLLSDGFVDGVGGEQSALKMLNRLREKDQKELLNEFIFHIKSKLPSQDDVPEQDCSVLVIDIEQHLLRVA